MMSHLNLISSLRTLIHRIGCISGENDVYIAYLPLAHVLELCSELCYLNAGIPIGYSSTLTLTDFSTGVKKGQKGDLRVLNPSLLHCVPAVLERIAKSIDSKIASSSWFKQTFFQVALEKKKRYLHNHMSTVVIDKILFNNIRNQIAGNKIKLVLSAGAILGQEVHEFIECCIGRTMQAYGLTGITENIFIIYLLKNKNNILNY
jgi:long-chain acyl-CoA synthetase